ncbi:DUF406 family protein [Shewanella woodyi]|uniref:DUF406 family protein n=1 Tax=Shewanella woodyi (strain ATCC 51908 / MS32) TaxID=392500 RepID=B1KGV6_SHEWM|nr:DUF406 family protein [Shewanella woodyi]ACA86825.1 conserved hypothetical protein [Shewanella woodyi ATCC 51908]
MKNIQESQSALVNDTCNDCGSYADIGAVIDEHDTQLSISFTGVDAKVEAEAVALKAKSRFDGVESEIKTDSDLTSLVIHFAYSAEKMIFQLENGI